MNLGCISAAILATASLISAKTYLEENFDNDNWQDKWKVPSDHPNTLGHWEISKGKFFAHDQVSRGLRTLNDMHFYALTAPLNEVLNFEAGELVVQFSAKNEQNLDCGGAYIKLFSADIDPNEFNGQTPYQIMFGPDVCGNTRRVHLILEREGHGRMIKKQIDFTNDDLTHMYTLVLSQPSKTYRILIDGAEVAAGKIDEDFEDISAEPALIPDPNAVKPSDWVDKAVIPDPEDTKPEDWDENEEWAPRTMENPGYKGEWTAPLIPNPKYVADPSLAVYKRIGFLGFDLWQVKAGTIFDNILVTDDFAEAQRALDTLFTPYRDLEVEAKKAFQAANSPAETEAAHENGTQATEDNIDSDSNEQHTEL